MQSRLHDEFAQRDAARNVRNEAELALARGREQLRVAERAAQEAGYAARSCRDRLAEIARRREGLTAQVTQQQGLLGQLTSERASIDWTPVEEALQRQLAARGAAEQALADARVRQESLTAQLRTSDEARLSAEQKLEPARARIQDMSAKRRHATSPRISAALTRCSRQRLTNCCRSATWVRCSPRLSTISSPSLTIGR